MLVIGYGLVGQERRGGGKSLWRSGDGGGDRSCAVVCRRPTTAGVVDLQEAIASADVVATATGGKNVVNRQALERAESGESLSLNVGHVAERSTASTCASTLRKR